jgi:hypothetical protein
VPLLNRTPPTLDPELAPSSRIYDLNQSSIMMSHSRKFRLRVSTLAIVFALGIQSLAPGLSAGAMAQTPPAPSQQMGKPISAPELQSLVAPIALYPDALLAQMLMASTYPLEVAAATIWLKNNRLTGDAFDAALGEQRWDNSVKSLVHFPDALNLMGNQLEWTHQLGDAYLADPAALMQGVQSLRAQSQQAGFLKSGNQMVVSTDPQSHIIIVPANPEIIYVPTYNPWVVYGPWPYVAYPPYAVYNPAWGAVAFGVGFGVGYALWATPYWGRGGFYINNAYYNRFNYRYNAAPYRYPPMAGAHSAWVYNPAHRYNVPYSSPALQGRYGSAGAQIQNVTQARQSAQNYWHQNAPAHTSQSGNAGAARTYGGTGGTNTGPRQSGHFGHSGHSGH